MLIKLEISKVLGPSFGDLQDEAEMHGPLTRGAFP